MNLFSQIGSKVGKGLSMLNPVTAGLQIIGGVASSVMSYQAAGEGLKQLGQSKELLNQQEASLSDITATKKNIATEERKEDAGFLMSTESGRKEDLTMALGKRIQKSGFVTDNQVQNIYDTSLEKIMFSGEKAMSAIDRKFGREIVSIDESEASQLAQIAQARQNIRMQESQFKRDRTGLGIISNMV
jgi:hypothetical protein|tara:strand:+ start:3375 stop:3935 length:561 start_codon:yes stop_codon:yes gene_type:complete